MEVPPDYQQIPTDGQEATPAKRGFVREFVRQEGPVALIYTLAMHLLVLTLLLNTPVNVQIFAKDIGDIPEPISLGHVEEAPKNEEEEKPDEAPEEGGSAPNLDVIPDRPMVESAIPTPAEVETPEPVDPNETGERPDPSAADNLLEAIVAPSAGAGEGGEGQGEGIASAYKGRGKDGRERGLARFGGSGKSESAVDRGLAWLAKVQDLDDKTSKGYGGWDPLYFGRHYLKRREKDSNRMWLQTLKEEGQGDADHSIGISALCSLAFTGRGLTGDSEKYLKNVEAAMAFFARQQQSNGAIQSVKDRRRRGHASDMYDHAIATMAVADYLAAGGKSEHSGMLKRAVDFLVRSQKATGGWDYEVEATTDESDQRSDHSITGFAIMALISAKSAGVSVPRKVFERVVGMLKAATHEGGRAWYSIDPSRASAPTFSMTAVNLFSRRLLGESSDSPIQRQQLEAITQGRLPDYYEARSKDHGPYSWYYTSLAMVLGGDEGSDRWRSYNSSLQRTLIREQERTIQRKGSWPPTTFRAKHSGGRVYATAIAVLTLEVYYRYLPEHMQASAREFRGLWE